MTTAQQEPDRLLELAATNLGVIEHLGLVFGKGMTVITGETGAGKTLLLTALSLLIGGRTDTTMIGARGDEAIVEGRFMVHGEELVLGRVIPRDGRSRAYVNGRLATAATLAEFGQGLVELHGQHGHTALTATSAQRGALDRFAGIDLAPLVDARMELRSLLEELGTVGGDERERLRQLQLYQFQVDEIDGVQLVSGSEDIELREREERLAGATSYREHAALTAELLGTDGAADDALAQALSVVEGNEMFEPLAARIRDAGAVLADIAGEARGLGESIESDPEQLALVQERRRQLTDLRRKYGDTLEDVLDYRAEMAERVAELQDHERRAATLETLIEQARVVTSAAEAKVGEARRTAAPDLAERVSMFVRELALPSAELSCEVGEDPGDDVEFLVSMNAGAPLLPLAKIASGGELARTMLALRMVLSADPATMVFDEVDAGVGGAAAQAVGAALGRLGLDRQVLVVTHLAQVAAYADNQVTVVKEDDGTMVSVSASHLDSDARIVELSRMLSGSPHSHSAREHAAELLRDAASQRALL